MNKILIVFLALLSTMFAACGGNQTVSNEMGVDSDFVADTVVADNDTVEQIVEETPMPKTADELFDDFFFNFAANKRLQRERISFPLPVLADGEPTDSTIAKSTWQMDYFFMRQGYYTLIFNNRKQIDRVKDTSISNVVVEKIYLEKDAIKEYIFERRNSLWIMTAINNTSIASSLHASFLEFYKHFASDMAFQTASIDESVKFVGPDPDDDFATMEGILAPDTWEAFAPELPRKIIYNIEYGEQYAASNEKIFLLRGIANGMETELTFRRKGNDWKIVSLTQ